MGVAYVVNKANFASSGLGKVTQTGNVPVKAIAIIGSSSVYGEASATTYRAAFIPNNTTQRGVIWSIVSGSEYASIDASTGELSVLSGASAEDVIIRATSTDNNEITAEKTLLVTYSGSGGGGGDTPISDLTACMNFQAKNGYVDTDIVILPTDTVRCKFAIGSWGTVFGSRQSNNSDDNGTNICADQYGTGARCLKVKFFGKLLLSGDVVTAGTVYYVEVQGAACSVTPSLGEFSASDLNFETSLPISIGSLQFADGTFGQYFIGDVYGIEILDEFGMVTHRLIPQSDLTFLDEVTQVSYPCVGTVAYRSE